MRREEGDGAPESCRQHTEKVGEDSARDAAADRILKCGGAVVMRRFDDGKGSEIVRAVDPSHFSVCYVVWFKEREREERMG